MSKNPSGKQANRAINKLPCMFRPEDLEERGISRHGLRGMIARGEVERLERGLYRLCSVPPTENEAIATVCARVPQAIVCLLTALQVYEIGTQASRHVWIAIDRKARKPRLGTLPVRIFRFSGHMLSYGVETRELQGVSVRITSPARTVVDCFRYRTTIGLDVAIGALRDALRSRQTTMDDIMRTAEVCRIRTVIRPYLESTIS